MVSSDVFALGVLELDSDMLLLMSISAMERGADRFSC